MRLWYMQPMLVGRLAVLTALIAIDARATTSLTARCNYLYATHCDSLDEQQ